MKNEEYRHGGWEKLDGGTKRWDRDGDGKLNWVEEHKRRLFDEELRKITEGEYEKK